MHDILMNVFADVKQIIERIERIVMQYSENPVTRTDHLLCKFDYCYLLLLCNVKKLSF